MQFLPRYAVIFVCFGTSSYFSARSIASFDACPFLFIFGVAAWKTFHPHERAGAFFLLLFFSTPASMLHVNDRSSVFINVVDTVKCRILKGKKEGNIS